MKPTSSILRGVLSLLAALLGTLLPTRLAAQGTLLARSDVGAKPRIRINGLDANSGGHVSVEFLVAGATSLSGAAATPFLLTLNGLNAGLFSKGVLTVNGLAPGAFTIVTVRAWDTDTGATFDAATVRATTSFGLTLGGVPDANGVPGPAAEIVFPTGFAGLNLTAPLFSGTIQASTAGGLFPKIRIDGHDALQSDNVFAEFLVEGATSLSGNAATPFQIVPLGPLNGSFSKGVLTANGLSAMTRVVVTVRAWDKDTGATFATAAVKRSSTFTLLLGGIDPVNGGLAALPATIFDAGFFPGLDLTANPPSFTASGFGSQTVVAGTPVTFATATLGTGPFTFVWTRNGAVIPGATGNSLSIPAASLADVGDYSVTVSNPFLSVTRRASLIVNVPTVAMPIASQSVCLGSSVTFSTAVAGTGPHTFTWTKDGVTIPGANIRTLTLASVSAASAGTYCVIVQGRLNAVTHCATLTVTAPPTITCPADITLTTTSGTGTAVRYATQMTTGGLPTTLVCTPPSGSQFPLGTTTVLCTASNACGTATCSFKVTVVCPVCLTLPTAPASSGGLKALAVTAGESVVQVADQLEGPWRDAPELEPGGPIPVSDAPAHFYRVQRRSLSK